MKFRTVQWVIVNDEPDAGLRELEPIEGQVTEADPISLMSHLA